MEAGDSLVFRRITLILDVDVDMVEKHTLHARRVIMCALVSSLFALSAHAAVRSSVQAGNWSDTSTWTGGVIPSSGDSVVITHAINLDASFTIVAGAELTINNDAVLTLVDNGQLAGTGANLQHAVIANRDGLGGKIAVPLVSLTASSINLSFTDVVSVAIDLHAYNLTASFDHCTFIQSPSVYVLTNDTSFFSLTYSTWRQTAGTDSLILETPYPDHPEGPAPTRLINGNVFDKVVRFMGSRDVTIAGNLFVQAIAIDGFIEGGWAKFHSNLIRNPTRNEIALSGPSSNNLWLTDGNLENVHFVQALTWNQTDIDGDIFHFTGPDDQGDAIMPYDRGLTARLPLKITRVIVLPNGASKSSATLFSALGGAGVTIIADHNTYFTGTQGTAVGETYPGHAGMLQSFRSNIAWDTAANGYKVYDSGGDDTVVDLVSPGAADFNCGFNLLTGSNDRGYHHLEFSSGAPGAHDVDEDPQFVDPARNILTWDASLGGSGNLNSALDALSLVNDASPVPGYTVKSLIDWIKAGFAPRNPHLQGAAHDGGDIGAVPAVIAGATATPTGTPVSTPTTAPTATSTSTPTRTPVSTPTALEKLTPDVTPAPIPVVTAPPAVNPTVGGEVRSSLGLVVSVKGRKLSARWNKIGKSYKVVLRRASKITMQETLKSNSYSTRLKPGTYSFECAAQGVTKPAVSRQKAAFKIR